MDDPIGEYYPRGDGPQALTLDVLSSGYKVRYDDYTMVRRRLGSFTDGQMRLETERLGADLYAHLTTELLAEKLAPEYVTEQAERIIHEARWNTWWDHFKATYRNRWWMSWRRWEANATIIEHRLHVRVDVELTRYWTFPEASVPPQPFGAAYRYTRTSPSFWSTYDRKETP